MSSYIEVRNVSKSFSGRAILQNISLSVEQGTTVGLVGANGSGKSVLFKIISSKPSRGRVAGSEDTGDPDMIVESGTVSGSNFASVYQNLKGALLHVDNGAHALIVTDVNGPARSQILICSHTADRKAIAISDFWNSGLIYYFIPQQIKVRNAPDVKITATLIRPVPVGRSLTLGGTTDITCNSLNVTVQSPTGQTFTANSSGRSVGKSVTLTSAGLYTITVTAQKTASSTPVVYVYTVRAY